MTFKNQILKIPQGFNRKGKKDRNPSKTKYKEISSNWRNWGSILNAAPECLILKMIKDSTWSVSVEFHNTKKMKKFEYHEKCYIRSKGRSDMHILLFHQLGWMLEYAKKHFQNIKEIIILNEHCVPR